MTIQVSLGPGEEVVPDVSGQSLSSAQSELQARGFRIGGPEEEPSDSVPAGQVVRTEPAAGETAERNSTVTVYVSSGVERVQVPYVIGESQGDASARLRGAGFEVRVEERTVDPGDPTGVVVYQDPAGGERADKGSVVEITVGVAATTTSTSSSSTTTTSSP